MVKQKFIDLIYKYNKQVIKLLMVILSASVSVYVIRFYLRYTALPCMVCILQKRIPKVGGCIKRAWELVC